MLRVRIDQLADNDLADIATYIGIEYHNPTAAWQFIPDMTSCDPGKPSEAKTSFPAGRYTVVRLGKNTGGEGHHVTTSVDVILVIDQPIGERRTLGFPA